MIVSVLAALSVGQLHGLPVTGLKLVSVPDGVTRVNGFAVPPASLPKQIRSGDRVSTLGTCVLERTATTGKTQLVLNRGTVNVGNEVEKISDVSTWNLELLKGAISVQEPFSQLALYDLRLGLRPLKGLSPIDTVAALKPVTVHSGGASFRSVAGIYGATTDERSLKVGHLMGIGTAFRGKSQIGVDARREVIIPTSGTGMVNRVSSARMQIMEGILDYLESAGVAIRITAPPPTPMFRLKNLAAGAKCTVQTGTYSRDVIPYFQYSVADLITHSGVGDIEQHGIDFETSAFFMESPFSMTYAGYGLEKVPDEFGNHLDRSFFMIESDDDAGSFRIREPATGTGTVRRPFLFKRKKKFSRVYGIGTEFEITLRADGLMVHCTKGKVGLTRKNSDTTHTSAILKAGYSQLLTDTGPFGAQVADSP